MIQQEMLQYQSIDGELNRIEKELRKNESFLKRKHYKALWQELDENLNKMDAKAVELILEDKHDFIAVYNKDYDAKMHKYGPEGVEALAELRSNAEDFAMFDVLIQRHWTAHNTLVGFAMDHGCHAIKDGMGSHGLNMPEDLNIVHFYKAHAATAEARQFNL